MPEPIRVGIVGANPIRGWALGSHLPPLQALPGFELVAVATRHQESAAETAGRFGVAHAFGDPAELIAHPDVDLVTISVKVPHHHALTRAAIEAGKHVFCEWPLGANTGEAVDLLDLATERGVRHVIGLQGRRSPMVNYVKHLVADGYVGELVYALLSIEGAGRGGEIGADREWTTDDANGVGMLKIIGGHSLDVLRYIVGDLTEVQADVAVRYPEVTVIETGARIPVTSPDVVLAHGRLSGGAFVSVAIQGGLPKGFGARLEIHGTDGVLVIASGAGALHVSDVGLRLSGASGEAKVEPMTVPDRYQTVPDGVPDTAARNVAGLYLTLATAIERGDDPALLEPSFGTAVELHRVLDEITAASRSGGRRSLGPAAG
ncbi:MAG TPA: Gfo/Idh/MocA family oxidoreductase [Acidimicrobiales bacterium]|jgi:predicted dehydrogenase